MTNQIINSLLEVYKRKQRSSHDLLRDPLFLSLTPEQQVQAVNAYAGILSKTGDKPVASKIIGKSVLQGAGAGFFASLPFIVTSPTKQMRLISGAVGGISGAILGAAGGINAYRGEKSRFETTNKYLAQLTKQKDVPTAINVLDENRNYSPKSLASLLKGLASPEKDIIDKVIPAGVSVSLARVQN